MAVSHPTPLAPIDDKTKTAVELDELATQLDRAQALVRAMESTANEALDRQRGLSQELALDTCWKIAKMTNELLSGARDALAEVDAS